MPLSGSDTCRGWNSGGVVSSAPPAATGKGLIRVEDYNGAEPAPPSLLPGEAEQSWCTKVAAMAPLAFYGVRRRIRRFEKSPYPLEASVASLENSSCEKARTVVVREFPPAAMPATNFANAFPSGISTVTTASYWPVVT